MKNKSVCKQRNVSKSKNISGRFVSKKNSFTNSSFSNLPKESGRLSASFYAKK
jgi:hypothetical protein